MLLRSISKHVKEQNWFAVGLDFLIVVIGVFIGIQVANWNDSRAFKQKETELLFELKEQIESNILSTSKKFDAYSQVVAAGKLSVAFIENAGSCKDECWSVIVGLYHASQWQTLDVNRSTYDEIRRLGLPKSRDIVDAVEVYLALNANISSVFNKQPAYRSHFRSLMPLTVHDAYWAACYQLNNGNEYYIEDCPQVVSNDIAAGSVDAVIKDPDLLKHLTFWYSEIVITPETLADQNASARQALKVIDAELDTRK